MNIAYQDTYKTQQKKALASLAVKANEEAVSACEAWAKAEELLREWPESEREDLVRAWWPKLARRPAGNVRWVSEAIREARPEQRQHIITRFAQKVPAIPAKLEKRVAKL